MSSKNYMLYDVFHEDWWFAHFVNQYGYTMTCESIALKVMQTNPNIQRSLKAARQHVAFIRRLLNGKCNDFPVKYTVNTIQYLQNA
jgi:uncharacterized protein (DUF2132 family)